VAQLSTLGHMSARRKIKWVAFGSTSLVIVYFGSYLVLLHPAFVGGGGTTQRIPCYVNPFTKQMVSHHLQVSYFFEPAQRLDLFIRPSYWCWVNR
jgi:hypothetical protein